MFIEVPPLIYALLATLCFSYSSTIFTEFARKISPFWMNSFKAFLALAAFTITLVFFKTWSKPDAKTVIALLSSGSIGLMIGDIFMLQAMKELGVARMLMIFGLQPFILGVASYFLFSQSFSVMMFIGVIFMLCCLFTISLERYKESGHWQFRGMLWGLIAISLDAIGVLLSRYGFECTPGISSIQVNFIRCLGAVVGFFVINATFYRKEGHFSFQPTWRHFSLNEKIRISMSVLGGTYCSLMLYLVAVSRGQLSVISSVSVTGPMFAEIFECARSRRWPSIYLIIAFIFFLGGFVIFSQV